MFSEAAKIYISVCFRKKGNEKLWLNRKKEVQKKTKIAVQVEKFSFWIQSKWKHMYF